ncbi:hypothetical protein PENTCL1PPCAC_19080, partial [Pristionchus entomophagus]
FFESLPFEIMSMILEYVPESVLNLRQASSALKYQVDDYARQCGTIQLIDNLTLIITKNPWLCRKSGIPVFMTAHVHVLPEKSKIFLLRLQLIHPLEDLRKRITLHTSDLITIDFRKEDFENVLEFLPDWTGRQIESARLNICWENKKMSAVSRILKGTKINRLVVKIHTLNDASLSHLFKMLDSHEVSELSLEVGSNTASADPVETLLRMATVLRCILITQLNVEGIEINSNYLFGARNVEWSRIILDMFSKKMDKLSIDNDWFKGYLSKQCADTLVRRLPMIGKHVWFEVTCHQYPNKVDEMSNNHLVQADDIGCIWRFLKIKHLSRAKEELFPTE